MLAQKGDLPVYLGGGLGWVKRERRDNKLGAHIPFGVEYLSGALRAFAEVVLMLNLTTDTKVDLEGGMGMRFCF